MSKIELNTQLFSKRLRIVYNAWNVSHYSLRFAFSSPSLLTNSILCLPQNAQKDDDYSTVADADALLLTAGDPALEDEPIRKGTAFQVSPDAFRTLIPSLDVSSL